MKFTLRKSNHAASQPEVRLSRLLSWSRTSCSGEFSHFDSFLICLTTARHSMGHRSDFRRIDSMSVDLFVHNSQRRTTWMTPTLKSANNWPHEVYCSVMYFAHIRGLLDQQIFHTLSACVMQVVAVWTAAPAVSLLSWPRHTVPVPITIFAQIIFSFDPIMSFRITLARRACSSYIRHVRLPSPDKVLISRPLSSSHSWNLTNQDW